MRTLLVGVCVVLIAGSVQAASWAARIKYWYSVNVDPNVPDISVIADLEDKSNGEGVKIKWKVSGPNRTKSWLEDHDAEADAWLVEYEGTAKADIDNWNAQQRAFAEVMLDEINILRNKHEDLDPRTLGQLKAAIKAKIKAKL